MSWFKDEVDADLLKRVATLEARVQFLENNLRYYTDDYPSFASTPKFVPLDMVVRYIARHLGMQIRYKPPIGEGMNVTFKDGGFTTNE